MGLFSLPPEVDSGLADVLIGRDRYALKKLAKEQEYIRSIIQSGEQLVAIANDLSGSFGISVVTDSRIIQLKHGRMVHDAARDRINGTRVLRKQNGMILAVIDGPGLYPIGFSSVADANRFVEIVDRFLIAEPPGPRDIPPLYPDFYHRLLRTVGKPASPENVVQVISLVARMITVGGAFAYFDQVGDAGARVRFRARFETDDGDGDRFLRMPDEMIDFLWNWHPACHRALRGLVDKIFTMATMPGAYLWSPGDQLPPWGEES